MKARLFVLPQGRIENDLAVNLAGVNLGSVAEPHPRAEWVNVPCYAFLLEHPTAGRVLFDCGPHPDDPGRLPAYIQEHFPWVGGPGDHIVPQLAALGLTPDDIDRLIVSHMHWDHCGGLGAFSRTRAGQHVVVGARDFAFGLVSTHQDWKTPFGGGGYFRANFAVPGIAFDLVEPEDGVVHLGEGLDLIQLGGHTPQVLGLLVRLPRDGAFLLPGDALYMARNFGPPPVAPGICYDTLGFLTAVRQVRRLVAETGAQLIYPHDPDQATSLRLAPACYE